MLVPFRDFPIRRKLTLANALTSAVALLIASLGFGAYERYAYRQSLVHRLTTQAEIVGKNSAAAVVFNDRTSAAQTLAALKAEPHIMSAGVYTRDGILFATYVRSDVHEPPSLTALSDGDTGHRFEDGR